MADRPVETPLPADLPEDWTSGQIIAPEGADAGLSEQHGYNYLMAAVNRAQRAVNAINESFDDISGKRTCRVTVGTSAAGWTQADCDYLCDGTDDQEELKAAVDAAVERGGGEIAILAGEYHISQVWFVNQVDRGVDELLTFSGEPGATVLKFDPDTGMSIAAGLLDDPAEHRFRFSGVTFCCDGTVEVIQVMDAPVVFEGCRFLNISIAAMSVEGRCFVLKGCEMEMDVSSSRSFVDLIPEVGPCLISGNTFYAKAIPALRRLIESTQSGVIFTGNAVLCDDAEQGAYLLVSGNACVANNYLRGAGLSLAKQAVCVGNVVKDATIISEKGSSVCGNCVENGYISVVGCGTVSGNTVAASSGDGAILAYKSITDRDPYQTPCITGNVITSGIVGIHLFDRPNLTIDPSMAKGVVSGNRISGCTTSIEIDAHWSECMVMGNMIDSAVVDNGTNNIVRLNSDDAGSGGSAGVSSFKGRSGAVVPQAGDYTAEMVGAVPAASVSAVAVKTQEEYDALAVKDPSTLYLITE